MHGPLLAQGLLQVHPGVERLGAVAHAPDEVGDGDAVPGPQVPQHGREEVGVLPAPLPVHRVVRPHDGGDTLVGRPLEVREVDVVENRLVDRHVHSEAGVLHGIQRVVLGARHGPALDAADERRAHLPQVMRVVAVRLLGPPPGRVAGQVDAHAAEEVATLGPNLAADHVPDTLLELDVPRGAARHGDGETGAVAGHAPAGAVDEARPGDAQALDRAVHVGHAVVPLRLHGAKALPEVPIAVEQPQPLLLLKLLVQSAGRVLGKAPGLHRRDGGGERRGFAIGARHAQVSSAFWRATWPSQRAEGFTVRAKVSRSTATSPKVLEKPEVHSKLSSRVQCR